jgi:hypothetical protein
MRGNWFRYYGIRIQSLFHRDNSSVPSLRNSRPIVCTNPPSSSLTVDRRFRMPSRSDLVQARTRAHLHIPAPSFQNEFVSTAWI